MKQGKRALQLHPRVMLCGTAVVYDSKTVNVLEIINVSQSGIYLELGKNNGQDGTFTLGQKISMTLKGHRFETPIQLKGTVLRLQKQAPKGLAVEFTKKTEKARLQLLRSVEEVRVESALNEKIKRGNHVK